MCDKFEPSKGQSILKAKCPQCQSGKMFSHSAFNLKKFTLMHQTCPVCNLTFEIEPGFFWGAMYVSYALTVGLMLALGGLILLISDGNAGFYTYIIPIVSALILSSPITYRYSRVLMIYLFSPISFNPELANRK